MCVTPNSTIQQCTTNPLSVYIVVSQVQENDRNTGVTDVEAFTSVATRVLKSITLNEFEYIFMYSQHRAKTEILI